MANRIVTITGTGNSLASYVTINGTKHYSAKSLTVADGTQITCTLSRTSGITVNGTAQASPYTFTVSADTTIALTTSSITVTYDAAGSGGGSGHKTKVGSTAYDIESGRIKKSSTVYELEKGTVKVSGAAREILFTEPVKSTVTITGTPGGYAYIKIGNTTYNKTQTIEVDTPVEISVYVGQNSTGSGACWIKLNGTTVQNGTGTYKFTLNEGQSATIKFSSYASQGAQFRAEITTT